MRLGVCQPRLLCGYAVLTLLVCIVWPATAPAAARAKYYVRVTGSDAADGRTPATAFRTIRKAASALLNAGEQVVVGPGLYAEGDIAPNRNGTEGFPVIFVADTSGAQTGDPAGSVVITPTPLTTAFLIAGRSYIVIDGFTLQGGSDAGVQVRTATAGIDSSNITLRNLSVHGARRGLEITASGTLTIENCEIGENQGVGVAVTGTAGVGVELAVRNLQANANGSYGMFVSGAVGGRIELSQLSHNMLGGLAVRASDLLTVANNTLSDNGEDGIAAGAAGDEIQSVANLALIDNLAERNAKNGVNVASAMAGEIRVAGNVIAQNGVAGIGVVGVGNALPRPLVTGNTVDGSASHGVFVQNTSGGSIAGNQLRNNGGSGLTGRETHALSVRDNIVDANQDGGIVIGFIETPPEGTPFLASTDSDAEVAGNALSANLRTGIRVGATGNVRILGNRVDGSPASGISVVSDAEGVLLIADNAVDASAGDGLFVISGRQLSVLRNAVRRSRAAAARFHVDGGVTLSDNLITHSGEVAVDIVAHDSVQVARNVIEDSPTLGLSIAAASMKIPAVSINDNHLRRHGRGGILIDAASAAVLADNLVEDIGDAEGPAGDGVSVRRTDVIDLLRNTVHRASGIGLGVGTADDPGAQRVAMDANRVTDNGKSGISVFASGDVSASNNVVLHNLVTGLSLQTGGAVAEASILGNTLGSNGGDGLLLYGAASGSVRNNRSFSNGGSGMTLRGSADLQVVNNLVYANHDDGIAIGTDAQTTLRPTVVNNTVYRNLLRGIRIDAENGSGAVSPTVMNNILLGNAQGGIAVARAAGFNYVSGFNVNADGYVMDTRRNSFDVAADPLLINPAGADNVLGGDGYADDDFHIEQRRAGQSRNSPALDAGSDRAATLGLDGSTASNGVPDIGTVDAGFHYAASASGDLNVQLPRMQLFVRKVGSDDNDGKNPRRALATISEAASRAIAGTTVVVGPGIYTEHVGIKVDSGRVVFQGDASGRLTGDVPGPVLIDAQGADAAFALLLGGPVTVRGFYVTGGNDAGIQVRQGSNDALIEDNVVFSNLHRGIEVFEADRATLNNNLVYANGTGGIRVAQSQGSTVINNTVYGNSEDGVLIGGTNPIDAATGSTVLRNIVAANGTQIKVPPPSLEGAGYYSAFNVVFGPIPFAGNTPRADSDFIADPLLVNPAGADGQLGGANFADDDFHLVQSAFDLSPAVDIDIESTNTLAAKSTRADGLPDLAAADAGYHYAFFPANSMPWSHGAVVFARATGDDANGGASPDDAVRTLARAQELAGSDGFLVLGPGTYQGPALRLGANATANVLPVVLGDESGELVGDAPGAVAIDAGGGAGATIVGPVLLDGVRFMGAQSTGVRVVSRARGVTLRNLTICGNQGRGVTSTGDDVDLFNTLVTGNGGDGAYVSLRRATAYTRLFNDTVAANLGRGVFVFDATRLPTRVRIFNNIIADNSEAGLTVRSRRGASQLIGNNLNDDGYGRGTATAPGDINAPPEFRVAAAAQIGCPSDEEFRVAVTSPALDTGMGTAIAAGLSRRSLRDDGALDSGAVDLGFHYSGEAAP